MPEKLGRYQILEKLGQGGFAMVYRAQDTTLERDVALKELRQALLQEPDSAKRFIREAKTIARLNHPRIVTIYDVLEVEERLLIVMRLVDGPSLERLIAEQGCLSWPQALDIISMVAEALDYAHGQGILHRDLKPANILLDPERGAQLTDFGLAKLAGEAGASLTATGGIVGTPQYIAPEVWEAQGTTKRSEVYALGCILYEMLTGQPLFGGDSPPAIMMAHFTPLTLPDTWPEGVPAGLSDVLTTTLAKAPAERYATAGELVAALNELTQPISQIVEDNQPAPHLADQNEPSIEQPAIQNRLPAQTTPFVGREAELTELARNIADPTIRLVTIVAPGGMGKTRLVVEAAERQLRGSPSPDDNGRGGRGVRAIYPDKDIEASKYPSSFAEGPEGGLFPQGIFFIPLAPVRKAEQIVPAIAEVVGYPFQSDSRSPEQQLLNYLREKKMLLVLDNFEQLLNHPEHDRAPTKEEQSGVGLVTSILENAPGVKLVITCRERLKIRAETVFALHGLDMPEADAPADALTLNPVKLFIQSARQIQPDFEPDLDDLQAILQICRLVQGMPLAILLASSWVEMLSPQELAAEISRDLDLLETDLRDVPERQRSIRAIFDYSWQRLSDEEQDIFMKLSVFRGGMSREAAQAVAGGSLRVLTRLIHKSLLQREQDDLYQVHELLRQYAREQLEASGHSKVARDAHCAYYADFLQQRQADLKGSRQIEALAEIEREDDNIRAAWSWAVDQGQVARLEEAMESMGLFYEWRGRYYEGEAAYRLAAEKLIATRFQEHARVLAAKVLAQLLTWQAVFNRILGRSEAASQLLKQSLTILNSPALGDETTRLEEAFIRLEMGRADPDWKKAQSFSEQSLILYQTLNDQWGIANALAELSTATATLGKYGEAHRLGEKCLKIYRLLGDKRGIADSLHASAFRALPQGNFEEAERLALESLAILRDLNDRARLTYGLMYSGRAVIWAGNYSEGYALLAESRLICQDLGIWSEVALTQAWLGYALCHLGDYAQARLLIDKGLALYQELDYLETTIAFWFLSKPLLVLEAYAEAHQNLQEALTRYRKTGYQNETGLVLGALGHIHYKLGDTVQTRQYLIESLQIATEVRAFMPLYTALPVIALLRIDRGETEQAVELYALLSRYQLVANSRWFEDMFGQYVTAAAKSLPPDIALAARTRGRSLDLWETATQLLDELNSMTNMAE